MQKESCTNTMESEETTAQGNTGVPRVWQQNCNDEPMVSRKESEMEKCGECASVNEVQANDQPCSSLGPKSAISQGLGFWPLLYICRP